MTEARKRKIKIVAGDMGRNLMVFNGRLKQSLVLENFGKGRLIYDVELLCSITMKDQSLLLYKKSPAENWGIPANVTGHVPRDVNFQLGEMERYRKPFEFRRILQKYFHKDYSHEAIRILLRTKYHIAISLRTLSRLLSKAGLKGKNIVESPVEQIILALSIELAGSGSKLGYKAMWKRIRKVYFLRVKQKTVNILLRELDSDGVDERSRRRMRRVQYYSPGPNYLWHADNHDKLKEWGFSIYGFIDSHSKKLLSLQVASTNNKPEVIAYQYIELVVKRNCLPEILRTDKGTDATIMGDMHMAMRSAHDDDHAGGNSYVRGKSTRNQRIESYWRQFRQRLGQYYMDSFKVMEEEGSIDIGNRLHIEALRYCFGNLLNEEIQLTRKEWNEHTIQRQNNGNVMTERPDELYHCPEKFGFRECCKPLNIDHAQFLFLNYAQIPQLCSTEFRQAVESAMPDIETPGTAEEAYDLYVRIVDLM